MIGETLGHYQIVRLLGKGGMGEDYVAAGEPHQLTHFTEGEIFSYHVSADHSELLIARGEILRDFVLIENFR